MDARSRGGELAGVLLRSIGPKEDFVMIIRALSVAALSLAAVPATAQSGPAASGTVTAFRQAISNVPGKSLVAAVVSYPPGAKSASHRHADSAFVSAYVLSGAIRS